MRLSSFVSSEQAKIRTGIENICGVLVHARPERLDSVRRALDGMAGVCIHQVTEDGRLVVTVEDSEGTWAGATITRIAEVEGILGTSLVYHHFAETRS